jgi:hypothetical protein
MQPFFMLMGINLASTDDSCSSQKSNLILF